jgi:catechol 2,3-dioxygenase-like lactoylglutathione lyase family enzyme
MPLSQTIRPVMQLRVAVTTADLERLLKFYADGLGIQPSAFWQNDGGRAAMLELGQASLEIFDETQARAIDAIEVGQRLSGHIRLALQVPDLDAAIERLIAHGAQLVHEPVATPWGDRNARFEDPDGLQVTLFQSPPETAVTS